MNYVYLFVPCLQLVIQTSSLMFHFQEILLLLMGNSLILVVVVEEAEVVVLVVVVGVDTDSNGTVPSILPPFPLHVNILQYSDCIFQIYLINELHRDKSGHDCHEYNKLRHLIGFSNSRPNANCSYTHRR